VKKKTPAGGKKWQVAERKQSQQAVRRPSIDGAMYGAMSIGGQPAEGGGIGGRFSKDPREVPQLGHGHLHICKSIDAK
jgi:hypothetical protein